MITNARDIKLNNIFGALPNVQRALRGQFRPITYVQIVQSVNDFVVEEEQSQYSFDGVIQPMSPEQLALKAEGSRSWKWYTVFAEPGSVLETNDVIYIQSAKYRVFEKYDWKEYGYVEYHMVQEYQDSLLEESQHADDMESGGPTLEVGTFIDGGIPPSVYGIETPFTGGNINGN